MNKKILKLLSLVLVLVFALSVAVACNNGAEPDPTEPAGSDAPQTEPADESRPGVRTDGKANRVALILEGAISDMSWNATAYAGLQKIEAMGAETHYVENVPVSAVGDSIRTFASSDYNIIFLATSTYADEAQRVMGDYPDVMFFLINSAVTGPNARSFAIQDAEQGFMMGALSAMLTKSGTVGFVGGTPINPIINGSKGFAQGVAYVDPDVKILSENTGSMDDVNAAKELAKGFVSQGADVLSPMANQSSLGVMEAGEEAGAYAIGSGEGQNDVAPTMAVTSVIKDTSVAYEAAYQAFLDNDLPEAVLPMGAAQGVVHLDDWYIEVDQEIKDAMDQITQDFIDGKIVIDLAD
ncbi:MAG: BMP family ABC transporter substrate-binding protein [Clostridiaceae bacterium]|nr:BMP family ABC transporter substrate-binding protein [Clostridiaceae bacterium]